ncbi:MAG: CHAD domain-containing protein [Gammaproteobacteria bacterium]|nr:CHAD domain-containing protein [Gammaproteobacteria bacterium]
MNSERTLEFHPGPWDGAAVDGPPVALPQGARRSARPSVELTLLDTFDRRLFRRGKICLVERAADGTARLALRAFATHRAGHCADWTSSGLPRFAWDVADPRLRSELEDCIDVRALLPQCRLRRISQPVLCFPEAIPEPLRIYRTRYALMPEHGRARALPERLAVCWSAPDEKLARQFIERLLERGLLTPTPDDIWREALSAAGRLPVADELTSRPELAPDQRADIALRQILGTLFNVMSANEAGIIGNIDTEFLHDFRVAIRRSRAALGQLKGVFPARSIARYTRDLAWLGEITGPARDLDVYLLNFAELQGLLPAPVRDELEPLRALLSRESAAAHAALVRCLASPRYLRFKSQWPEFLARPGPRRPAAPNALEAIGSLSARRIWTLYRRIARASGAVDADTPSEQIHALRKTCKKLRYLLEFVQPFHETEQIRRPIRDLKVLQDHLGAFQDAEVQMAYLRAWFARLRQDPRVSSQTLLALGMLFGRFEQIQAARRAEIPGALRHFARKDDRNRFKAMFKLAVAAAAGSAGRQRVLAQIAKKQGESS